MYTINPSPHEILNPHFQTQFIGINYYGTDLHEVQQFYLNGYTDRIVCLIHRSLKSCHCAILPSSEASTCMPFVHTTMLTYMYRGTKQFIIPPTNLNC